MPVFTYTAKRSSGEMERATLKADSRHHALGILRSRQLIPINLEGTEEEQVETRQAVRLRPFQRAVSLSARSVFCRQLAISVSAGVSLRESLESIASDIDHPGLRAVLNDVVGRLHGGMTFSQALARHPSVFDALFVSLIRAAEESGSLPQTLEQLADTLERNQKLASRVRSITAYPIFIGVFFILISLVMTLWVLPKFGEVFSGMGAQLPPFTRVVFGVNRFFIDNLPLFATCAVALVVGWILFLRTEQGKLVNDRIKLRIPLFGVCLLKHSLARFAENLAMMVRGGVPVKTALEMSAATCGNRVVEKALLKVRDRVVNGSSIAHALEEDKTFPRLVVRMINVGETSGRLPEVLERVARVYENEVESAIMMATSLFEPLMICVFGGITLVLVLAVYIPVFSGAAKVQ